ncbi:MAG: hypothetical protein M1520_01070 [Candidatus Marsarchaeota archaeon]|nr:hypothetical protein [Candidatus Marsarchaeota archaeon]
MNKTTAIGISVLAITMLFSMVSAQGTLQSPGYNQANEAGTCHGVFGSYFGTIIGGLGSLISSFEPATGNLGTGTSNSNPYYCSFTGETLTSPWHPVS